MRYRYMQFDTIPEFVDLAKDAHSYHHRHYMGKVESVKFESYESTLERFQQEWLAIVKSAGGGKS